MMIEVGDRIIRMQPDSLNWDPPRRLGTTGNGKPVFAPYSTCRLMFTRVTKTLYTTWHDMFISGDEYTFRLPHPESGRLTAFTARVTDFSETMDTRDQYCAFSNGVDIVLSHIEVT